ncbi:hypothetical protein [Bradyrhizobium sp. CCBAU 21360]|uniref:hypothetical protein n=1 Tax=Bradyrhizobium sp. CCBAU 21360 TaxID=1325081 RepID=UPI0023055FC0|nr:hypothetical protein [Bradyrhizobium sp. CCBAU 21360]
MLAAKLVGVHLRCGSNIDVAQAQPITEQTWLKNVILKQAARRIKSCSSTLLTGLCL